MRIAPFKIEEWMNIYEKSAVYDLTTTCIAPLSLNELPIEKDIFYKQLTYGDIEGSLRLKNAIKNIYENMDYSNITITHGGIGANQLVFYSLLEKGDEVVSIVPTYQQLYSIPESLGCKTDLYFLKEENEWLPDIEELDNVLTSKTKLLCFNNPNNPTGAVIPNNLLMQIVEICKRKNIWILSDEVYRGLNLYGNPYSNSIADIYDKGISIGSLSKTYSLPGIRVGWVVAREDLIKEINRHRQYNTISVSILDDYIASVALENKEKIQERNFRIMQQGFLTLANWLKENPIVSCVLPKGGTTVLLKYNKDIPSRKLCKDIQYKTGVALLPGETLEMKGYVRIGYCSNDLENALPIISNYLLSV